MLFFVDSHSFWHHARHSSNNVEIGMKLLCEAIEMDKKSAQVPLRPRLYDEGECQIGEECKVEWSRQEQECLEYYLPREFNREQDEKRFYGRFPRRTEIDVFLGVIISCISIQSPHIRYSPGASRLGFRCHLIGYYPELAADSHATPDYIHQDNVGTTSIFLLRKENVIGGLNQFYALSACEMAPEEAQNLLVKSFSLDKPGDMLIWEDNLIAHYMTPVRRETARKGATRIVLITDVWEIV